MEMLKPVPADPLWMLPLPTKHHRIVIYPLMGCSCAAFHAIDTFKCDNKRLIIQISECWGVNKTGNTKIV